MKLALYLHTLRHLKPVQFYGRLRYRLYQPRPDISSAPEMRPMSGAWLTPARREISMLGAGLFQFMGVRGTLVEVGWNGPEREKLWRYNQHYFDDLNALDAPDRRAWHYAVLAEWVVQNPPGNGNGWEAYPTSLRIVNWLKWALSGNPLPEACVQSLAAQVRWLSKRLEIHLLGNHLFANAKALVFAGTFFDGPEAEGWQSTGFRILAREIPEQILADGGHFERSTMYHALAYEDMLDLVNVTSAFPEACRPWEDQIADWPRIVRQMGHWLRAMCHPDGEIGLFNDAAFEIAPAPKALLGYAARLNCAPPTDLEDVVHLDVSGYIRLNLGDAVLLIDAAPVGPDYLPGHAHADTLSFELSIHGRRVVVNGGTSRYGTGSLRDRERGTSAHSTVEINQQDSSEVWAGFRVARRAYPFDVSVKRIGGSVIVEAAHDGYRRLSGKPIHRRRWILKAGSLEVTDLISGDFDEAIARVHFHPDIQVTRIGLKGAISWADKSVSWKAHASEATLTPSEWHPKFGVSIPSQCLALKINSESSHATCRFLLEWR